MLDLLFTAHLSRVTGGQPARVCLDAHTAENTRAGGQLHEASWDRVSSASSGNISKHVINYDVCCCCCTLCPTLCAELCPFIHAQGFKYVRGLTWQRSSSVADVLNHKKNSYWRQNERWLTLTLCACMCYLQTLAELGCVSKVVTGWFLDSGQKVTAVACSLGDLNNDVTEWSYINVEDERSCSGDIYLSWQER